jgi:hypothetical protein
MIGFFSMDKIIICSNNIIKILWYFSHAPFPHAASLRYALSSISQRSAAATAVISSSFFDAAAALSSSLSSPLTQLLRFYDAATANANSPIRSIMPALLPRAVDDQSGWWRSWPAWFVLSVIARVRLTALHERGRPGSLRCPSSPPILAMDDAFWPASAVALVYTQKLDRDDWRRVRLRADNYLLAVVSPSSCNLRVQHPRRSLSPRDCVKRQGTVSTGHIANISIYLSFNWSHAGDRTLDRSRSQC